MFWPNPYFSISKIAPATSTIAAGGTASYTISTLANAGYTGTSIQISVAGLPAGATYNQITGAPGTTFTLSVTTPSSTPTGSYPFTISATDGSQTYFAYATLVVRPTVSGLFPSAATAGGPAFTLIVNGSGFQSGSTVQWIGSPLVTGYVNSNEVTTSIPANLIASPGSAGVAVMNPGGATSTTVPFTINAATSATTSRPALSSLALHFGSETVGLSSAPQTVTLTNIGPAALTLTNIIPSGDFSESSSCVTVPISGTCTITVTFTPTANGSRIGLITIIDDGSNSPQVIRLYGTGTSGSVAAASLSALDLNFGRQSLNTTSTPQTVTFANSGGATLTVSGVSANGNFAETNNCTSVVPASTCTINVTFIPTATGPLRGSVVIVDNAAGSPQVIRLSGTGTAAAPAIGLSNVSLDFASQATGTPSSPQTITVTNTGSATLTITGVATTGDFAASGCVASLAAGATCTLSVTFTPTVTGARRGTVAITDNVAGSPHVVQLFGDGT
jgi:hypothetical protein